MIKLKRPENAAEAGAWLHNGASMPPTPPICRLSHSQDRGKGGPGASLVRSGPAGSVKARASQVVVSATEPSLQQPVAVGDPDQDGIAVSVPVLPSGGDQALDFFGGQVLAGAALGLGNRLGRNCPILTQFEHLFWSSI